MADFRFDILRRRKMNKERKMKISYKEFLEKVTEKLSWVADEVDFMYPYTTREGKYENGKNHPFSWTSGFYGGILWYMYLHTKNEKYLKLAKECSQRLEQGLTGFNFLSHDVGFQFLLTNVADYIITGDEEARKRGLHAAALLAGRYNTTGKYIRAWNENPGIDPSQSKAGYVIIDCMMNIPLLYWASDVTGDPRYKQIANLHADTAAEHFIREDGSVNHIVVFDPNTGEVVDKPEGQGYAKGSSWTRGQTWAIYGFAMAYHYTKNEKYLEVAKKVARYFMANVKDYMPIDFAQPTEPKYEDSSAAAICACGLLEIMKYVTGEEKDFYKESTDKMLEMLYKNCDFTHNDEAILQNCSEMYHREESRHVSLIYGDFYLLEALIRLNGGEILFY